MHLSFLQKVNLSSPYFTSLEVQTKGHFAIHFCDFLNHEPCLNFFPRKTCKIKLPCVKLLINWAKVCLLFVYPFRFNRGVTSTVSLASSKYNIVPLGNIHIKNNHEQNAMVLRETVKPSCGFKGFKMFTCNFNAPINSMMRKADSQDLLQHAIIHSNC